MTVQEIGKRLIELYVDGKARQAIEELYADNVVSAESVQGGGPDREVKGKEAVLDKSTWWFDYNELHRAELLGPYPHGDSKFAVFFKLDLTNKQMDNARMVLEEVGVYEVDNGKIVREEFYYNS